MQAGGIGSWLKAVADNYYLVNVGHRRAQPSSRWTWRTTSGSRPSRTSKEVAGNLSVHWEGEAKEAMFEWFADASAVVSILMIYADSAQLSAGAAGDAIGATQQLMLRHAENGRDALKEAVEAWRKDNDVFPFPPGVRLPLQADRVGHLRAHRREYADRLPAPADQAVKGLLGMGVEKLPYSAQVLGGYKDPEGSRGEGH